MFQMISIKNNPDKEHLILLVYDYMIADMNSEKKPLSNKLNYLEVEI